MKNILYIAIMFLSLDVNATEFNVDKIKENKRIQELLSKNSKIPLVEDKKTLQPDYKIKSEVVNKEGLKEMIVLSMPEEDWFAYIDKQLTVDDKRLLREYEKDIYSPFERRVALLTKTSANVKEKAEKRFLFKEMDIAIQKINQLSQEKQELAGNFYTLKLYRYGNELVGDFNLDVQNKEMLKQLKKDKSSYYSLSYKFVNNYFCSMDVFKLWMFLDKDILLNYRINKDSVEPILYEFKPKKENCN